jgi:hypothetical protein
MAKKGNDLMPILMVGGIIAALVYFSKKSAGAVTMPGLAPPAGTTAAEANPTLQPINVTAGATNVPTFSTGNTNPFSVTSMTFPGATVS